jgi:endopolyphosphatase
MDHFFFLDAKKALEEEEEAEMLKSLLYSNEKLDISTFSPSEMEILSRLSTRSADELLDSHDEIRIMGAEEYMSDLKEMFENLPAPPKPKKWRGRRAKKERKRWERKFREYEENYQVVQVAPSVIPTYFSGIRVFEYNVSELAGQLFSRQGPVVERTNWTEFWEQMDREIAEEAKDPSNSRQLSKGLSFQNTDPTNQDIRSEVTDPEFLPSNHDTITKKKKSKKPPIHLPQGPHKSSPRGPLFETQLFTPIRWEVHFVNLTEMNIKYDHHPKRSWNYSQDFFKLEYTSDGAPYHMKDMTVGTWLDLGRKIGREKTVKKKDLEEGLESMGDAGNLGDMRDLEGYSSDSESDSEEDIAKHKKGKRKGKGKKKKGGKGNKKEKETFWDVFLRRAFINSGHQLEFDSDD